jgi:hypothetical protein
MERSADSNTVKVAVLEVAPFPPLVDETAPVVLFFTPTVVPVTFTVIAQVVPGVAMLPPVRLMLPEPAVAVTVPPQLLVSPFGVATTNPAGNVSVKATPVSVTVFADGFVIANVNAVVPLSTTVVGLKAF